MKKGRNAKQKKPKKMDVIPEQDEEIFDESNGKKKKQKDDKPKKKDKKDKPDKKAKKDEPKDDDSSEMNIDDSIGDKPQKSFKLVRINLDNFKSFNGSFTIGDFKNFTSIIGPNGSGKSNIIEAIFYALGSYKSGIRAHNRKDFICNSKKDGKKDAKCFVELIFDEEGDEVSFKKVTDGKTTKWYYNKSSCSQEEYEDELEKRNIHSKLLYFILTQGSVDSFFSRNITLSKIIDILSGSSNYKDDYDEALQGWNDAKTHLVSQGAKIRQIKQEKSKVDSKINGGEEFKETVNKINDSMLNIYLYKLLLEDKNIHIIKKAYDDTENEIKKLEGEKKDLQEKLQNNEAELIKKEGLQKAQADKGNLIKNEQISIKNGIKLLDEEYSKTEKEMMQKTSTINQLKIDQNKKIANAKLLEDTKKNIEQNIRTTTEILESNSINDRISPELKNEYKLLHTQLQTKVVNLINQKQKYELENVNYRREKEEKEKDIPKLELQKKSMEATIESYKAKKEELLKDKGKGEVELNQQKVAYEKSTKLIQQYETECAKDYADLKDKIQERTDILEDTDSIEEKNKLFELISKYKGSVLGFLFELIIPLNRSLELPIKISLIKYLGHLVVDKVQTATKVSEFLKKKNMNYNILVLENIPKYEVNRIAREKVKNMGMFMIDLIDCKQQSVKTALSYFLKDMLYCKDLQCIKDLRGQGFRSFITIDGTIYRKNTITGGNYRNLSRFSFNYDSNLDQNHQAIDSLSKEIEDLQIKIKKEEELKKQELIIENELKEKISHMENTQKQIQSNITNYENKIMKAEEIQQEKESELQRKESDIKELNKKIEENEDQINKIDDDVNAEKMQIFKDFMRKNNLNDLSDFEKISLDKIIQLRKEIQVNQEKLSRINSLIQATANKENEIKKLDEIVSILKQKLKKIKEDKEKALVNLKEVENKFTGEDSETQKFIREIKTMQDEKKAIEDEIESIGQRLRSLMKGKLQRLNEMRVGTLNKKDILLEAKTNPENMLVSLGDVYVNGSARFSAFFDIDEYITNKDNFLEDIDVKLEYEKIAEKLFSEDDNEYDRDKLRTKIDEEKEELRKLIPTLGEHVKNTPTDEKVIEELINQREDIESELKDYEKEMKELKANQEKCLTEYTKLKEIRATKFKNFFNKFQTIVQQIYYRITEKKDSPGGQVTTYLTNENEPFDGNVIFLPTPPGKKNIYDIDLLSGGEKTISVLVLLVALRKVTGSPLIILDEIDAYLDHDNVELSEKLFREMSNDCQMIVVTHKSSVYRSADSLIGTYYNPDVNSTIVTSIELQQNYDEQTELTNDV